MNQKYKELKELEPDHLSCFFQNHIKDTFHASLGVKLLICEQGHCLTRTLVRPEFTNSTGALHGGFLFTIADTTAGLAALNLGCDNTVTTVDSHFQYLRPAVNLDCIYCESQTVKDGKRLAFVDVKIFTEEGVVLAKGSFTFAHLTLPNVLMPKEDCSCN